RFACLPSGSRTKMPDVVLARALAGRSTYRTLFAVPTIEPLSVSRSGSVPRSTRRIETASFATIDSAVWPTTRKLRTNMDVFSREAKRLSHDHERGPRVGRA